MRSDRRHELEQNELAEWLTGGIESVKPYANVILGLVILILVFAVGGTWWARRGTAESTEAWDAYHTALASGNPDELLIVSEDYPASEAARWAEVVAGDLYLDSGCSQLFTNRADANIDLDKAVDFYQKVLEKSNQSGLLNRASYGLARTREAMGDMDKAKALYEKVTKKWPEGPFAAVSAQRLEELQKPSTLAFYDEFEKFDPKPAYANEPGVPGSGPLFDDNSLISPDSPLDPSSLPNLDLEGMKTDGTK